MHIRSNFGVVCWFMAILALSPLHFAAATPEAQDLRDHREFNTAESQAKQETLGRGFGNIFREDQVHHGNFTVDAYLARGWTGYHIAAKVVKSVNYLTYDCGKDCSELIGPLCPDGDCAYRMETQIFRLEGQIPGRGAEKKR